MVGLEPTSLATHASEACVFTNFTTSTDGVNYKLLIFNSQSLTTSNPLWS